jgi:hypothetical protein
MQVGDILVHDDILYRVIYIYKNEDRFIGEYLLGKSAIGWIHIHFNKTWQIYNANIESEIF